VRPGARKVAKSPFILLV